MPTHRESGRTPGRNIDGLYDHEAGSGLSSKWGVLAYRTADFRFIDGLVENLKCEHAFYFHNNAGETTFRGTTGRHLGRTFVQVVQRRSEGHMGTGTVTIEECFIEDCALEDGGSCITIAGHADPCPFDMEAACTD